ncbi:MAG: hypothetical protein Q9222_002871 [Ikaeria aurantiellina]
MGGLITQTVNANGISIQTFPGGSEAVGIPTTVTDSQGQPVVSTTTVFPHNPVPSSDLSKAADDSKSPEDPKPSDVSPAMATGSSPSAISADRFGTASTSSGANSQGGSEPTSSVQRLGVDGKGPPQTSEHAAGSAGSLPDVESLNGPQTGKQSSISTAPDSAGDAGNQESSLSSGLPVSPSTAAASPSTPLQPQLAVQSTAGPGGADSSQNLGAQSAGSQPILPMPASGRTTAPASAAAADGDLGDLNNLPAVVDGHVPTDSSFSKGNFVTIRTTDPQGHTVPGVAFVTADAGGTPSLDLVTFLPTGSLAADSDPTSTMITSPPGLSVEPATNSQWTSNTWITTTALGSTDATVVPVLVGCPECGGRVGSGLVVWHLPVIPRVEFDIPGLLKLPKFHLPCIHIFGIHIGSCSDPSKLPNIITDTLNQDGSDSSDTESDDKDSKDKNSEDKNSEDKNSEDKNSEDKDSEDKNSEDKDSKDKDPKDKDSKDKNSEDKNSEDKNSKDKDSNNEDSEDDQTTTSNETSDNPTSKTSSTTSSSTSTSSSSSTSSCPNSVTLSGTTICDFPSLGGVVDRLVDPTRIIPPPSKRDEPPTVTPEVISATVSTSDISSVNFETSESLGERGTEQPSSITPPPSAAPSSPLPPSTLQTSFTVTPADPPQDGLCSSAPSGKHRDIKENFITRGITEFCTKWGPKPVDKDDASYSDQYQYPNQPHFRISVKALTGCTPIPDSSVESPLPQSKKEEDECDNDGYGGLSHEIQGPLHVPVAEAFFSDGFDYQKSPVTFLGNTIK